jgi:hypothetical protein
LAREAETFLLRLDFDFLARGIVTSVEASSGQSNCYQPADVARLFENIAQRGLLYN